MIHLPPLLAAIATATNDNKKPQGFVAAAA
jgi:hypothetical protein